MPNQEAVLRKAIPRFDPSLTPQITQALNEAQIVFAATGMLRTFQWQAMNPVLMGPTLVVSPAVVRRGAVEVATEATGPASRLVPGSGLAVHEAAGGHLLAKHVGLADAQLAARLTAEEAIPAASTFSIRAVAERAAAEAIDANQAVIVAWLKNGGGKLQIEHMAAAPVGRVLHRGAAQAVESMKLLLVLVRDTNMGAFSCRFAAILLRLYRSLFPLRSQPAWSGAGGS